MNTKEKLKSYKKTKEFSVVDTFPEKHFYCITPLHLQHSEGMYLDIEGAEEKGAKCDICKKKNQEDNTPIMTFKEHKEGLLIGCEIDIGEDVAKEKLKKYLLSIKDKAEKDGYVGFAFLDKREKKKNMIITKKTK